MESNLVAIPECINYVNTVVDTGKIKFSFLSDAPLLIKIISNGGYCACGDTVYVPQEHFQLVTSKNEADRTIATAKLLPWIMAIKDGRLTSVWKTWLFLKNYKSLARYFMYEYGFLKFAKNPYCEIILGGFVTSRTTFFGRKLPPEDIIQYLNTYLTKVKAP